MPRMENAKGEALYYNVIMKNGKIQRSEERRVGKECRL